MEILSLRDSVAPPLQQDARKFRLGRFRCWLAGLLSLLLPGLGQILNRQPVKAMIFWLAVPALFAAAAWTQLLHSYAGFISWVVLQFLLYIGMIVDAFVTGRRQARTGKHPVAPRLLYIAAVALVAANLAFPRLDFVLDHVLGVRAFRIPADSTKPTLVKGDHLVADMKAFSDKSPSRGDVVVFASPTNREFWVKRVIAIAGDEVAGDCDQIVLNGKRVDEPYAFLDPGSVVDSTNCFDGKPTFGPIRVPDGKAFLVGDNRYHSFDSRFAAFGLADIADVRGRAMYLYNAEDVARIGQRIR